MHGPAENYVIKPSARNGAELILMVGALMGDEAQSGPVDLYWQDDTEIYDYPTNINMFLDMAENVSRI